MEFSYLFFLPHEYSGACPDDNLEPTSPELFITSTSNEEGQRYSDMAGGERRDTVSLSLGPSFKKAQQIPGEHSVSLSVAHILGVRVGEWK